MGGNENDREFRLGLVELADQLKAIGAGELQVGDDHLVRFGEGVPEPGVTAGLHRDVVAAGAHRLLEAGGDVAVVFDQEDFRVRFHLWERAAERCGRWCRGPAGFRIG